MPRQKNTKDMIVRLNQNPMKVRSGFIQGQPPLPRDIPKNGFGYEARIETGRNSIYQQRNKTFRRRSKARNCVSPESFIYAPWLKDQKKSDPRPSYGKCEVLATIWKYRPPVVYLLITRKVFNGVEKERFLLRVLHVSVDEKAVHLRVNVLDGDLKSVEASSLGNLECKCLIFQTWPNTIF